jgi:hypothetical protein
VHVLGEVPHGARALHLSFLSFDHSTWQRFQISQFHAESAAPNMGAWETCRKEAKENEMNMMSTLSFKCFNVDLLNMLNIRNRSIDGLICLMQAHSLACASRVRAVDCGAERLRQVRRGNCS